MDETERKRRVILQIFARYPSLMAASELRITAMTAAYLEDCGDLTAEEIAAGFTRYRVAGSSFPPSGPELRKHGLDARADRLALERSQRIRLAARPRGADAHPPEHRAEMQRRFADLLQELRGN